jgi:hypothetical protein
MARYLVSTAVGVVRPYPSKKKKPKNGFYIMFQLLAPKLLALTIDDLGVENQLLRSRKFVDSLWVLQRILIGKH